ncbi:GNAT family N-acetyltransferase [Streptomyces sp. RKND-216]|uniref:GNAT family N-acetyltransferase n=1 Tax=Streptomyces sp. RKND-216 TaxID=2562581 RepID=UPI00109E0CE8|nr:GNAT family N-acetyltransferase [Streptomyces sp. RKND-216]THA23760.1 GNAT family N-acetyltransferase [Streptomyces sp. RKND-216]
MRIRETAQADAGAVAALRIAGWRYAYAGLMPPAHLSAMDAAEDAVRHRARLASPAPGLWDLVAEDTEGKVVGWAAGGPYRDGERRTSDAELYALYARPDMIGTGVGRALASAARERALRSAAPRLYVWVVEGNARARRFYERAGFAPDGGREDFDAGGRTLTDLRYVRAPV